MSVLYNMSLLFYMFGVVGIYSFTNLTARVGSRDSGKHIQTFLNTDRSSNIDTSSQPTGLKLRKRLVQDDRNTGSHLLSTVFFVTPTTYEVVRVMKL